MKSLIFGLALLGAMAGISAEAKGFLAPLNVYPITIQIEGKTKYELESVIEISIGTPPQKIHAAFDTGSFVPVIYNKSCTMPDCGDAVKYDTAKSSTAKVNWTAPVVEDYGAGNTSGWATLDNFSFVADVEGVASNWIEGFVAIDYVKWYKSQAGLSKLPTSDGIFGMGPEGTGPEILVKQFGINEVAVRMPRGQPFSSGVAQFGGYDKVNPEMKEPTWTNTIKELPWFVIVIDDVLVDGVSTGQCKTPTGNNPMNVGCGALLDTGGGIIEFSDVGVPSNSSTDSISCDHIDRLPNIGLKVNGTVFTLEPQDYVLPLPNGRCQSAIVSANAPGGRGMPTVHDIRNKQYVSRRINSKADLLAAGPEGLVMDFGIQFTSRVTTIFNWKDRKVGLIEHR